MPKRRRVKLGDLFELANAGSKSDKRRTDDLTLGVVIDEEAPRQVVLMVRDALVPLTANARVSVRAAGEGAVADADLTVIVAGARGGHFLGAARSVAAGGRPYCVVVESAVEETCPGLDDDALDYVVVSEGLGVSRLARWLAGACPHKRIALGANFAFCRGAVDEALAFECAKTNAMVGAVDLISSADFPVMLMSQATLAFDLAACHGKRMGAARASEVAAVAAGALAYRALARRLVRALPQMSWAVRGVVGFAGTMATGLALSVYHSWEGPLPRPFAGLSSQRGLAVSRQSL